MRLFRGSGFTKPVLGTRINSAHPLSRGLVTALLFNEAAGNTVYDATGNGGNVTGVASPTWGPGQTGSAGYLNVASTQYYTNSTLRFPTTEVTLVFISRVNSANNNCSIAGQPASESPGGTGYFNLHYLYGGTIYWRWGSASSTNYTVPVGFTGSWRHSAFTCSAAGSYVYTDGVLRSSGGGGTRTLGNMGFQIGNWSSYPFDGQIEQVLVYNRVLSSSEINWLYSDNYAFMSAPRMRGLSALAISAATAVALAGTLSITSLLGGSLNVNCPMNSTVAGTSALNGNLSISIPLNSTMAASATQAGTLGILDSLAGNVFSNASITPSMSVIESLSGLLAIQSGLVGSLFVSGSLNALAGQMNSALNALGSLSVTGNLVALAGQVNSVLGASGSLSVSGSLNALAGQVNSSLGTSGTLIVSAQMAAMLAATNGESATITLTDQLSGTIAGTTLLRGTLTIGGATSAVLYYYTRASSGRSISKS
jgi:hypothetical protein